MNIIKLILLALLLCIGGYWVYKKTSDPDIEKIEAQINVAIQVGMTLDEVKSKMQTQFGVFPLDEDKYAKQNKLVFVVKTEPDIFGVYWGVVVTCGHSNNVVTSVKTTTMGGGA